MRSVMTRTAASDPNTLAWIASSSAPGAAVSNARHACQLSARAASEASSRSSNTRQSAMRWLMLDDLLDASAPIALGEGKRKLKSSAHQRHTEGTDEGR